MSLFELFNKYKLNAEEVMFLEELRFVYTKNIVKSLGLYSSNVLERLWTRVVLFWLEVELEIILTETKKVLGDDRARKVRRAFQELRAVSDAQTRER